MKNLITSLIKFQKEVPTIVKDKSNPFFKSRYSDLASVINGVSETLGKCDLSVFHRTKIQDGRNVLVTILAHSSGEIIESELFIPEQSDPQKLGSLITYLKRYSYMAILGIASEDEDDDANSASGKYVPQSKPEGEPRFGQDYPPTEKQKDFIKDLCSQVGKPYAEPKSFKQAQEFIERLKQLQKEKNDGQKTEAAKSVKDTSFKLK